MRSLFCAALLCAAPVFASPVAVFKSDAVTVYAYTDTCPIPEIAAVLAQFGPSRKAAVLFEGRELQACYVLQGDKVLILDSDGDGGAIPAALFVEAKGA
jgi:hypothetical protein